VLKDCIVLTTIMTTAAVAAAQPARAGRAKAGIAYDFRHIDDLFTLLDEVG
jgi:hypothetical protein